MPFDEFSERISKKLDFIKNRSDEYLLYMKEGTHRTETNSTLTNAGLTEDEDFVNLGYCVYLKNKELLFLAKFILSDKLKF